MLSKKAQYAFRALTVLVEHNGEGPLPISAIVREQPMSTKFLETILLELRRGGILGSRKGKGGGYYLMCSPKDVSFAQVIRILDGAIAPLKCVSLNFYERCDDCDEQDCGLHRIMAEVRDSKLKVLEKRTLADLA
ncbi:MAG: transcriptional regulator [Euryarchaeota archaeon]|nr:transcriptional regulator [Euryarchaeota archaeon]|tara:strand:- start:80 stop:484 length:405 start_codon:yes stop_codon:yes gene_type:complete